MVGIKSFIISIYSNSSLNVTVYKREILIKYNRYQAIIEAAIDI